MNLFSLLLFGLLITVPACGNKKKAKPVIIEQERTQEVADTQSVQEQPKQIKF